MNHAKSLRAIGQSLEAAKVTDFEIEKSGENYLVLSNTLTHRLVRFTPVYVLKLDGEGQKQRQSQSLLRAPVKKSLSQLLRTLGHHLDKGEAKAFRISWRSHSVSVNYERQDGQNGSRMFRAKDLQQIGSQSRRLRTPANTIRF
jgi:hypothetical protein